jgi:NAD(P)-dependent dehydrogenase (short-subunit alcohol dehydrogenase family)
VQRFGGLQGLVNCAGIVHGEKVVGKEGPHTLAGFVRAININLVGTFKPHPARGRSDGARRTRTPAASAASSSTPLRWRRSTARSARRPTRASKAASSA